MLHNILDQIWIWAWCLGIIPVAGFLNNLGGQSVTVPRLISRVVFMAMAVTAFISTAGLQHDDTVKLLLTSLPSFLFWAIWKWGPGFMALPGVTNDYRDYSKKWWTSHFWIAKLTDKITNINPSTILTQPQINAWGMAYMNIRGSFLYVFFISMAIIFTPWALLFGLPCFMQGKIYARCMTVPMAEYIVGWLEIGAPVAATFIVYLNN